MSSSEKPNQLSLTMRRGNAEAVALARKHFEGRTTVETREIPDA